ANEDHVVELEGPIFVVDLLVREGRIGTSAARVETASVVREGERAVLEVDAEEVRRIEREAKTERRSNCHPAHLFEARRIRAGRLTRSTTIAALLHAHERDTAVDVEVRVDEELLEQRELSAERAKGDLRGRHPTQLARLVLELRSSRAREVDRGAAV